MHGVTTVTGIGATTMGLVVGVGMGSTLNSEEEVGIYSQVGCQQMENY